MASVVREIKRRAPVTRDDTNIDAGDRGEKPDQVCVSAMAREVQGSDAEADDEVDVKVGVR